MILSQSKRREPASYTYAITARQARNACVIGCVGGLVFMAIACAVMG